MELVGGARVVDHAKRSRDTPLMINVCSRCSLTPRKACVIRAVPLAAQAYLRMRSKTADCGAFAWKKLRQAFDRVMVT